MNKIQKFIKGIVTSLYSSSPNFQMHNIVKNKKKAKEKILNTVLCLEENILLKRWFTWSRTSFDNNKSEILVLFLDLLPEVEPWT